MTSLVDSLAARALMRRVAAAADTTVFSRAVRRSRSFIDAALDAARGCTPSSLGTDAERHDLQRIVQAFRTSRFARAAVPETLTAVTCRINAALAGFACDALSYAAAADDALAIRLAFSPYSGIERDVAAALVVAAAQREPLAAAIRGARVPLWRESEAAAQRFARALEGISDTLRAQGISAREMMSTILSAFRIEPQDPGERQTAVVLHDAAEALDAARGFTEEAWETVELIDLIDDALASWARGESSAGKSAPLCAHPRETAAPVVRRRGHFSASALGTYAECERKWYYRYVCAAVEDRGSSASFYGSAFHYALEQFHREFPRAVPGGSSEMASKLDAYIVDAFERFRKGFPTTVEFELQKRRARRTASRYFAWFLERSRAHPFEVIGQEVPADVDLEGYRFVGYIDRLDRDDATANVTVVDYKTGAIAQTAADYRERIARFVDFQLPFYYWARTAQGERVTRLALIPLREAHLDVRPIELEVIPVSATACASGDTTGLIGIDELERARRRMVELARRLSEDVITGFTVTNDPSACTYCAYWRSCRHRPRRYEDRFGR